LITDPPGAGGVGGGRRGEKGGERRKKRRRRRRRYIALLRVVTFCACEARRCKRLIESKRVYLCPSGDLALSIYDSDIMCRS